MAIYKLFFVTFFILIIKVAQTHAYTITDYIGSLNQHRVTDINEAIPLLPDSLKNNFALVHTGHGLRGTSFLEPAIIGFATDGSFFVNVGSLNQKQGQSIEFLQFNKAEETIELYELDFPLIRDMNGLIPVPKANPQKCLGCHGQKPVALWGDYEKWKGFYGNSIGDGIKRSQLNNFLAFKEKAHTTAPYKYFNFDLNNILSPFRDSSGYKVNLNITHRPNSLGGFVINRINAIKMARQIKQSPLFSEYKFKLIANLICRPYTSQDTIKSDLNKLGLSDIDLQQLQSDGVSSTASLIGSKLINDLSPKDKKRFARKFKQTSLSEFIKNKNKPELYSNRVLLEANSKDFKIFDIIDEILLIRTPYKNNFCESFLRSY